MAPSYLACSERGFALAQRIAAVTGGSVERLRTGELSSWTERHFVSGTALVYVGAVGIAVRAIAPYVRSKTTDPAVIVIDERGRFVIPLLSGHLGGANELALRLAMLIDATPVITTATDVNGAFAVDCWARHQDLTVINPKRIKAVSTKALTGGTVRVCSRWPLPTPAPEGVQVVDDDADVVVDVAGSDPSALWLVPHAVTLGIGCRRGVDEETIEQAFSDFCNRNALFDVAIRTVATIDLKADEPGLLLWCAHHDFALATYGADELAAVEGDFQSSPFVASVTGVDNVCERTAVAASKGGALLFPKTAYESVTLACALDRVDLDWRA